MYEYTNEAKIFVENNNYDTAFDIVEIILNSIPDVSIDDSNGSTGVDNNLYLKEIRKKLV